MVLMNENRARNVRLDYDVKDAYLDMKPVYKHFRKKNSTPPTEQKTHPSKNILRGGRQLYYFYHIYYCKYDYMTCKYSPQIISSDV